MVQHDFACFAKGFFLKISFLLLLLLLVLLIILHVLNSMRE